MTGSQYKNVIKWSILLNQNKLQENNLEIFRIIFNNLGIAYPNAKQKEALAIIKRDNFLGWRNCTVKESQLYANKGVPAIAANDERIIIICPDRNIGDLSAVSKTEDLKVGFVKTIFELSDTELKTMSFLTYSHGNKKIIENEKLRLPI